MTRHTIYRIALATLMLPVSFTAYWWLLPRRMKKIRTTSDLLRCLVWQRIGRRFAEDYREFERISVLLRSGETAVISERKFRLPFRLVANPSGQNWVRDRFLAGEESK